MNRNKSIIFLITVFILNSCAARPANVEYKYPEKIRGEYTTDGTRFEDRETVFGKGGLKLFGGREDANASTGIGVNSFLWRATLDTLAFMPLLSADPFGGVIITEWYSPPETPQERFKINAYILERTLRADGIKVTVFRQEKNKTGEWIDAVLNPNTATELENAILTRARQLRIAVKAP